MKASEFVREVLDLIEKHGDLPIVVEMDGSAPGSYDVADGGPVRFASACREGKYELSDRFEVVCG